MTKITIIGVGLIGGSIGIGVREKKLAKEVVGVVHRPESIEECLKKGAVDKATLDVKDGVKDADMVILSTPISRMEPIAKEVSGNIKKDAIVIDIASVKEKLVYKLENILGKNYVGTHPMTGSEQKGVAGARLGLFNDAVCIITPTANTRPKFLKTVREFWKELGSRVVVLSPEEHDRLVSFTSHLPHLLAASLVNILSIEPKAMDTIGPGFRDSTRIAKSQPAMWQEICEWNREDILSSIDKFQSELSALKKLIESNNWNGVLDKLKTAKDIRDGL